MRPTTPLRSLTSRVPRSTRLLPTYTCGEVGGTQDDEARRYADLLCGDSASGRIWLWRRNTNPTVGANTVHLDHVFARWDGQVPLQADGGNSWYLMGLHFNDQSLRYSLSTDGMSFQAEQSLFNNLSTQDLNIVALSYVTRGNQLLG